MLWPVICQGRTLSQEALEWLRWWIGAHRDWSRKRLARELCVLWDWRNGMGRLKDFAALGQNIGYLARDSAGQDLAVLLFGAAAWRCAPRDRHLDWSESERLIGLHRIANNSRFLILPHVRVPHLVLLC